MPLFAVAAAFAALLGLNATSFAADPAPTASELVVSEPAAQSDVTVYGNQFAQVQETRKITLKAGANRIQLNGIAANYRPASLRLVGATGAGQLKYKSATYQAANLTTDRLLLESVGKEVTAWRTTKDGLQAVTGKLLNVNGGLLALDVSGKVELVTANNVSLSETPKGLSTSASLVVETTATADGEYTVEFFYETGGLSWSAQHSLFFDDEKSVVTGWESSVVLVNNTGTSFKNATFRLLTGKVAAADAPGRMYGARSAMAAPMSESADAAVVESVGDQKTYTLPNTVDLGEGQTRQVPLFSSKDVPVKQSYVVGNYNSGGYYNPGKQQATVRLTVNNCEAHNLGKALPGGIVKVYQANSGKKQQLAGSVRIGDKAQDEIFDLDIATSSDVKWEAKLAKQEAVAGAAQPAPAVGGGVRPVRVAPQQNGNEAVFEDHTYEITVFNFKRNKDVEVKVEISVPGKQDLAPEWKKPSADRAETTITVKKSDKTTVTYTIRVQTR